MAGGYGLRPVPHGDAHVGRIADYHSFDDDTQKAAGAPYILVLKLATVRPIREVFVRGQLSRAEIK